jgi:hypothetical protein
MLFKAYKIDPDHRGRMPIKDKSQWEIGEWEELILFTLAKQRDWISPKKAWLWSIHIKGGKRVKIGKDEDGDLFIAKYKTDSNDEWHGYPVSPRQFDIPPQQVLDLWLEEGFIDKADKKRIIGGKF